MEFTFAHNNFNVRDLEKSMAFYKEALGLEEVRRLKTQEVAITATSSYSTIAYHHTLMIY